MGASGNSGGSSFGRGAFYIYEYAGSDWALQRGVRGLHIGDSLGQAVGIDDESGSLVVVGAPGDDSGLVRIYEKVAGSCGRVHSSMLATRPAKVLALP